MNINLDDECRQNPEEKVVTDERCYCGHLKSEHLGSMEAGLGHVGQYLSCSVCSCDRFTWYGWIFSDRSEV